MTCPPTSDPEFLTALTGWFCERPEVLILFRYPYAAGNKDFEFFTNFESVTQRFRELEPRTIVIAFRKPQLPIRGLVDDNLIARCLSEIPDGAEYLVVEAVRRVYGKRSWFHHGSGGSHAELRKELEESRGTKVAAGLYPDWLNDSEDVISAIVPDPDGRAVPAAY